ncbi:acylphosphatase [Pacificimonas flava]|uniref:acylphosphatase n=2 Tax=Pacificimonas TaxID=1960290 RepID=A0A219B3T6_9SPHN|nr:MULTISPECIES: acylphosphatase [Pacificimonas]MBZ6377457.1 acylphosphatase [Pacificimonas aurantium]OWV32844.1 acylphosphatase [Pacificimonas flava]
MSKSSNPPTTFERCERLTVRGRVQGVGYRAWTVRAAKEAGVSGWVRNMEDGTVQALLCGTAHAVEALAERMRAGPPAAGVSGLDRAATDELCVAGFEQRPTASR